jgi:hypothetical protein
LLPGRSPLVILPLGSICWIRMMKKTPLSQVKERFGSKQKLIEAIEKLATDELWIDRYNELKGLQSVSNTKLLRLFDRLSEAKERFGSREQLIEAIAEVEKRVKDEGYKTGLNRYPVPRLLDRYRAAIVRARRAEQAGPAVAKKRTRRLRKPKAKTRAARA